MNDEDSRCCCCQRRPIKIVAMVPYYRKGASRPIDDPMPRYGGPTMAGYCADCVAFKRDDETGMACSKRMEAEGPTELRNAALAFRVYQETGRYPKASLTG